VAAVLIYPGIMLAVAEKSDLVGTHLVPGDRDVVMWALTVLFALGAVANLASRSSLERVWSPVSMALSICCALIAIL